MSKLPPAHGVGEFSTSEQIVLKDAKAYDSSSQESSWQEIGASPTTNQEAIDALASNSQGILTRKAIWDFSVAGDATVWDSGVTLPDQALATYSLMEVLSPLTGSTQITFTADGLTLGTTAASSLGPVSGAQDWTGASMVKMSADSPIIATLTGTPTSGRVSIITFFVRS
jgi:hypothetical protein